MAVGGFECEFVGEAPRRSECPICLLVLREPHQATCCGKTFCQACISEIKTRRQPCPACKEKNFDCYPDKGLKQELYSAHVFCSNRREGCEWQGELRELDHHLNLDPTEEKQLVGCGQAKVKCLHCPELYKRAIMKRHRDSECPLRPTTCDLCKVFKSTYEEVTDWHKPDCKCRLVACPNSCGVAKFQHQHLEEHKFRQCPLSLVECEFSDAGCEVKVLRQDLPSHLREEVVTHLSLLASENRRLKTQLQEQAVGTPPLDILFTVNDAICSSKPFYSHNNGYKLRLEVRAAKVGLKLDCKHPSLLVPKYANITLCYILMDTIKSPVKLHIFSEIVEKNIVMEHQLSSISEECCQICGPPPFGANVNDNVVIRVNRVSATKE